MAGGKRIKAALKRGAIFKGILMRPSRPWTTDHVLGNLHGNARSHMCDKGIYSGIPKYIFFPHVPDKEQADTEKD